MTTVRLRNINPLGQVDLPLLSRQAEPLGEHGSGCLEPGEEFDCDVDLAGHPPAAAVGEPGEDGYVPADLGSGLLAQIGNYELVNATDPAAVAASAAAAKAAADAAAAAQAAQSAPDTTATEA